MRRGGQCGRGATTRAGRISARRSASKAGERMPGAERGYFLNDRAARGNHPGRGSAPLADKRSCQQLCRATSRPTRECPRREHGPVRRVGGRLDLQRPGRSSGQAVWSARPHQSMFGPNRSTLGVVWPGPGRRLRVADMRPERWEIACPVGAHSCPGRLLLRGQLKWRKAAGGVCPPPSPGRTVTSHLVCARLPTDPRGSPLPPARAHSVQNAAAARTTRNTPCPPPLQGSGGCTRCPVLSAVGSNRFHPQHGCRTIPLLPAGPRLGEATQIALFGQCPDVRIGPCLGRMASRATEAKKTSWGSTSWSGIASLDP